MTGATGAAELVGLDAIRDAAERIRGVARRTPLVDTEVGDGRPPLWLKCENLQHGGAFKVRGAYNFIAALPPADRERGLITYSSGNHAQGVAYAAREFGARAVIVMPEDAPSVKRDGTRRLGGEIVLEGLTTEERKERAEELARERGFTVVPPFDDPAIVAGQGTVGLEIVDQLARAARHAGRDPEAPAARPALALVPVGGGGLVSGVAAALSAAAPGCRVVGVEPEGAASMRASLEAGRPVTLEHVESVADGLKPVRPGDVTFRHVRELVDEVVTVTDAEIRAATLWTLRRGLVAEPSGAAAAAALLSGRVDPPPAAEGATAAVVSGGNVDAELIGSWLTEEA